jgi:hypothetical protein
LPEQKLELQRVGYADLLGPAAVEIIDRPPEALCQGAGRQHAGILAALQTGALEFYVIAPSRPLGNLAGGEIYL